MHRHHLTWLAIFAVIALMFLNLPRMVAKQDTVLNTYSALVEVDALVRQQFVMPVEDQRLVYGAIRGMMLPLDPYSGYIAPAELATFLRRNKGEYTGIGIEVGVRRGRLTVITPIEGSPASHSGVRAGDTIMSIDGRDTNGLSVFDMEELLNGASASSVRLRVLHPGELEPVILTIKRGHVSLHTVRGFGRDESGRWRYLIDPEGGLGYVRVSSFLDNTMRDFDAAVRTLQRGGVRGIILDLRFNPGGLMPQAVAMVDRFVGDGLILSTLTRHRAVRDYRATPRGTMTDVKLAVLINGASASAAEIVAGSLQAHGRATIVGQRSFGKGSVQRLIRLTDHHAAVKLTTAYYRLPDGRIIHRTPSSTPDDPWGIEPDVRIELSHDEERAIRESWRALDGALDAGESGHDEGQAMVEIQESSADGREILRDRQLATALALLRRTLAADSGVQTK